jgi:uncharacterized phiE125 gp8 family phage protein
VLPGLIASARTLAEQETGRLFVAQTWRVELTDWPAADEPLHVYRPSAAAVTYWDGSTWATLATNLYAYAADPTGAGTLFAPALGTSWPTLGSIAVGPRVRIDLTAGVAPTSVDTVPDAVKAYIIAMAGEMLDNPTLSAGQTAQAHPLLSRLLDPWRLYV